ncbi:MAG: apolipoprotein N-acyltransferase [Verrucomicrobia bacterium]|nr:apolipoprotein N-acyltransferase [Verrucomicrobiota bacterium]
MLEPVVTPDPYAPVPTWRERSPHGVAAVVVFVLTALIATLSFPPFKMPEFAYAMLVPGIFWAYTRPSLKLYAWTMFAAQAVAWTAILSWLHHVTWLGLILLGPLIGAWVGAWYLAAWWAMPRMLGRPTLLRLAAMLGLCGLWVVIEWTRTWLLGGFPWLPLAASQWERSSILQVASYTGAYGISFVLVAMNIGFGAYAHRLFREGEKGLRKRSQEFFLAMFLLLVCVSIHMQESFNRVRFSVPVGRIAFVQPYIPQDVKWVPAKGPGILSVLEQTTMAAAATMPDLILWPEATTPWAVKGDEDTRAFVESLSRRAKAPMLVGSIAIENRHAPNEEWYNAVFAVDPLTGVQTSYYAKRRLVPFGEYVPLRPILGWISKFVPVGEDFATGLDASPLVVSLPTGSLTFGPLVCYEDIYPQLARSSVRTGADILVVQTNNAWFGEGGAAYQHAANSVLRAVETRRPVLRCGNGGWSGWIDEFGSVRAVLVNEAGSIYFRGVRTVAVRRDQRWVGRQSFYVEHGDWFVGVSAALVLLGFALLRVHRPNLMM